MQLELLEELVRDWYMDKNAQQPQDSVPKAIVKTEAYKFMKRLGQIQRRGICVQSNPESLFTSVLQKYLSHLQSSNAVDFGSFIQLASNALENSPEILDKLKLRFEHILVDEFQDTDPSQFRLLQALSRDHQRVTVVGDDDQQIYSWRGASGIGNFQRFSSAFSNATITRLEQNFRSTGAIVAAARSVIGRNQNRLEKSIRTRAPAGNRISICECRNEACEAAAISDFISGLKRQGVKLHDVAILYRLHRVGVELHRSLRERGIRCGMRSGSGNDGTHPRGTGEAFADIIAVMRLILNESDESACRRLLKLFCPSHSDLPTRVAQRLLKENSLSFLETLKTLRSHLLGISSCRDPWVDSIARSSDEAREVSNGTQVLLRVVADSREDFRKLSMGAAVRNLLQRIGPYREEVKAVNLEADAQSSSSESFDFAGIKALLQEASSFDNVEENRVGKVASRSYKEMKRQRRGANAIDFMHRLRMFLDQLAIKTHDFELGEDSKTSEDDQVTLSTIHQAKGLEWNSVVLARANEGVIPFLDFDTEEGSAALEEERRLMYVTLTRAKESVLVTHLMIDGRQTLLPSRFLADIPKGLVNRSSCYEPGEKKRKLS